MFFYEVEGHMQKLRSFRQEKKIWPKKTLTLLMHAPLHLSFKVNGSSDSQK